jgi:putative transposase
LVLPADISDGQGAKQMLEPIAETLTRMRKLWVDSGYQRGFVDWIAGKTGWDIEVVRRIDQGQWSTEDQPQAEVASGFQVLPFRWIVERTFAWLSRYRRLSKDYEETTASSASWVVLAMSRLLLARVARGATL